MHKSILLFYFLREDSRPSRVSDFNGSSPLRGPETPGLIRPWAPPKICTHLWENVFFCTGLANSIRLVIHHIHENKKSIFDWRFFTGRMTQESNFYLHFLINMQGLIICKLYIATLRVQCRIISSIKWGVNLYSRIAVRNKQEVTQQWSWKALSPTKLFYYCKKYRPKCTLAFTWLCEYVFSDLSFIPRAAQSVKF